MIKGSGKPMRQFIYSNDLADIIMLLLHNNDTVIAATNPFRGDDVYSGPKDSINLGGSIDYDRLASAMSKVQVVSQVKVSEFANPITTYQQQNMRRSI